MSFPRLRFEQAGASPDELECLAREFDALPEPHQRSRSEHWAGLAQGDLVEVLEARREEGTFPAAQPPRVVLPEPPADTPTDTSTDASGAEPDAAAGKPSK